MATMATSLINGAMELLHDKSLPTIELLQTSFPENKNFMINISTLFDPRYVFLIYAPLLFALNKRVGHRTIIALTLAEWANQILKWLLAGERPYWYVHERAQELQAGAGAAAGAHNISAASLSGIQSYDTAAILMVHQQQQHIQRQVQLPQLKQFPVTCELGAGSPSGHAMATATVWYILIDAYLKGELQISSRLDYSSTVASKELLADKLQRVSWAAYTLILVLVSLSRVYLACHFPHQCLCGAVLGLVTARLVAERLPMDRLRKHHFVLTTCFMFASALGTFAILRAAGLNPLWTVQKGMRWCVKKEYIHLDTTPFFSMMRYLGFCLGAGLAYDGSKLLAARGKSGGGHLLAARRLAVALAGIAFGQLLLALPVPKTNLNLFYAISFCIYTLFSYSIAGPIPQLVKRALASPRQVSLLKLN